MNAILNKVGVHKTKPISGAVLQDGFNKITLAIQNNDGTKSIKSFTKDKYAISYY